MNFFETLKKRWNVQSVKEVLIILLVFTCTGFTSLYIKKPIFDAIGIRLIEPHVLRGICYTLAILIFYNILLLVYGFVFGKFRFFLAFEKRFFARLANLFRKKKK